MSEFFEDKETYKPLILFEYDHKPGHYCLMMSDNHMVLRDALFAAAGQEPGGYSWEAVARQAQRARSLPKVNFDPEAGTFVAYGEDLEALKQYGAALGEAFHDDKLLARWIAEVDPDWWD